ncbi:hypothetical protein HLB09_16315, partial [Pseudokineococcus marinus]
GAVFALELPLRTAPDDATAPDAPAQAGPATGAPTPPLGVPVVHLEERSAGAHRSRGTAVGGGRS